MQRQRKHHGGPVYVFPHDFPQRLRRLKEESGLSWAEIARRLGVHTFTIWHWLEAGVQPHHRHLLALLELAEELGLSYILTTWTLPPEEELDEDEVPSPSGPDE